MKRPLAACALAAIVIGVPACQENSPTSVDPGGIPVTVQTFEIDLPWTVFGDGAQTFGGFGTPSQLGVGIVADDYRGSLRSRMLARSLPYPERVSVRRADGVLVQDSVEAFVSGRVIASVDTLTAGGEAFELTFGALDQNWHAPSATWELASDTSGVTVSWDEPGAGPVSNATSGFWEPGDGDSVIVELPSELVSSWADSAAVRGFRLDLVAPGRRLTVRTVRIELEARAVIRPDTLVTVSLPTDRRTFIYTPEVPPTGGALRVGGAPAFRSVLATRVPSEITAPSALCAVVECPYQIEPQSLNRASLILTTRSSQPAGFQPADSLPLDVRPVLAPEALPKSPLGDRFLETQRFDPALFGEGGGQEIEVNITGLVRGLVGPDSATTPSDIALLSRFEPFDVSFAEFEGPESSSPPILRLLLTVTDTVRYR